MSVPRLLIRQFEMLIILFHTGASKYHFWQTPCTDKMFLLNLKQRINASEQRGQICESLYKRFPFSPLLKDSFVIGRNKELVQ